MELEDGMFVNGCGVKDGIYSPRGEGVGWKGGQKKKNSPAASLVVYVCYLRR